MRVLLYLEFFPSLRGFSVSVTHRLDLRTERKDKSVSTGVRVPGEPEVRR